MRKNLEQINGDRKGFIGVFERYGTKTNFKGFLERTILLKEVSDGKNVVTDHIWFTMTKGFEALGDLNNGDKVEFCARVKEYVKGYVNRRDYVDDREIDYRLSHPTKVQKCS